MSKTTNKFQHKTTGINQLWQTDFTYIKISGWGWFYLSTVLDDYSRYIVSWKLCTKMRAQNVTDTLYLVLQASGCVQVHVVHKLDLSRFDAAPLIAFVATREMSDGAETNR